MKIYLASSWRNLGQPGLLKQLREAGYDVYDFRHPSDDDDGFHWSAIDPKWREWTPDQFRQGLKHPLALKGFGHDMGALISSDVCLLLLPCGRSAHLELGWAAGAGKKTIVLATQPEEAELMYKMLTHFCVNMTEVFAALEQCRAQLDRAAISNV